MHYRLWTLHWHRSLLLAPHLVAAIHVAAAVAVIATAAPAVVTAVAVAETDFADCSVVAAAVGTAAVARFEESQKLYLFGPSC